MCFFFKRKRDATNQTEMGEVHVILNDHLNIITLPPNKSQACGWEWDGMDSGVCVFTLLSCLWLRFSFFPSLSSFQRGVCGGSAERILYMYTHTLQGFTWMSEKHSLIGEIRSLWRLWSLAWKNVKWLFSPSHRGGTTNTRLLGFYAFWLLSVK